MAGSKKDQDKRRSPDDGGLATDAWQHFERAVDVLAKSKPRPKRRVDEKPFKPATKKDKRKKP